MTMKQLISLFTLMFASAMAFAANPSYGEHGMALFGGKDGLYAAHLPMFHAPHDFQVVLRLHLADPAQDRALRSQLEGKTALWTLAPEKFELDRLAPDAAQPLASFKARLVLGHFEQDGVTKFSAATVVVDKVLLFRQLSAAQAQAPTARYMQLGRGAQRFLVKLVDSRPDFDHIVAIRASRSTPLETVSVAKKGLIEPCALELQQALPGAAVLGSIYYSVDDLK
jgi:hypothetical protein